VLKTDFKKPVVLKNFHKVSNLTQRNILPFGEDEDIQSGMEVEHDRFGKGKVLNVEGNGPNKKATIFFSGIGQKQLLLRFAKLKIVK
jgi:DNA helicase-2/ATP-dependent DNA helicase PcrA